MQNYNMQLVLELPWTDEELQKEFEEQLEEFRRMGLLPIEADTGEQNESNSNN